MSLGNSITTTGIVRIVVKVTEQHIGKDLGILLHEVSPYPLSWDSGIALSIINNVSPNSPISGYDGNIGSGAFVSTSGTKTIAKGTIIALWFTVDIAGETHGLWAQTSTEADTAKIYSGYKSRAAAKSYPYRSKAKFCTVFVNDTYLGGFQNTTAAIEVLSDAVIVPSITAVTIEEFTALSSSSGLISTKATDNKLTVFPTLATDFIKVSADEEISSVRIFSLEGKKVFDGKYSNQIEVSALKSGSYIIEAKTISNNLLRKSFLKK